MPRWLQFSKPWDLRPFSFNGARVYRMHKKESTKIMSGEGFRYSTTDS